MDIIVKFDWIEQRKPYLSTLEYQIYHSKLNQIFQILENDYIIKYYQNSLIKFMLTGLQ